MLKLPEAVAIALEGTSLPVISDHGIDLLLHNIFEARIVAGQPVALRKRLPTRAHYIDVLAHLLDSGVIRPDPDFHNSEVEGSRCSLFQILSEVGASSEEVAAIADPFCYLSHSSAMDHHGLHANEQKALVLSTPAPSMWRGMRDEEMLSAYGSEPQNYDVDELRLPLQRIIFPKEIRGIPVVRHDTKYLDECDEIPGSRIRVTKIGETFVQMLERPAWCGGMNNVLRVFDRHAERHHDEILAALDRCERPIVKVRAGYILEERLCWSDHRILKWRCFAQRGSSRVLDPEKPFAPRFSENWMLSLNLQ